MDLTRFHVASQRILENPSSYENFLNPPFVAENQAKITSRFTEARIAEVAALALPTVSPLADEDWDHVSKGVLLDSATELKWEQELAPLFEFYLFTTVSYDPLKIKNIFQNRISQIRLARTLLSKKSDNQKNFWSNLSKLGFLKKKIIAF